VRREFERFREAIPDNAKLIRTLFHLTDRVESDELTKPTTRFVERRYTNCQISRSRRFLQVPNLDFWWRFPPNADNSRKLSHNWTPRPHRRTTIWCLTPRVCNCTRCTDLTFTLSRSQTNHKQMFACRHVCL
jgi:hypothetical protein